MQYLVTVDPLVDAAATPTIDKMAEAAQAEGEQTFQRKIKYLSDFGRTVGLPEVDNQVLSQVMLSVLDEKWKDHLYDLDQLRNAIQYRAWGQKDPLVEYKREAFEMFEDLMHDIQSTFTERFFKIQVSADPPPPEPRARRAPPPEPAAGRPIGHGRPVRLEPEDSGPTSRSAPGSIAPWVRSAEPRRRCPRSAATIPARAVPARSTRSVTGLAAEVPV